MDLILKGFIIGIGKIIPGVSGSLLAIRLNVYEKMMNAINDIFYDFKNSVYYLGKLGIGILLAISLGSNVILFLLNHFYYPTIIIFLILIATGIPMLIRETNHYLFTFISFVIYFILLYVPTLELLDNYYFIGFLESFTTIIPGISGTALFMSFGLYDELLDLFSNIHLLEFNKLIPFSIGLVIGTLILVRFINYCFKNYRSKTYAVILGLLLASMVSIIIKR